MKIRVLIVNPSHLTGGMFAKVLSEQPDFEVVGDTTDYQQALNRIDSSDLVLLSTNLPDDGAYRLTRAINHLGGRIKILVVGQMDLEPITVRLIEAGAHGYVDLNGSVEELLNQIRRVYRGEPLISPALAVAIINRLRELAARVESVNPFPDESASLTQREYEILDLIRQGYSNQDIANYLVIEVGTVKNHVHNILSKLKVSNRRDAANSLPFVIEQQNYAVPIEFAQKD